MYKPILNSIIIILICLILFFMFHDHILEFINMLFVPIFDRLNAIFD